MACITIVNMLLQPLATAASLYWDSNGSVSGADPWPYGIWGADPFWNSDSSGGSGTFSIGTTSVDDVFLVAGPGASSGSTAYEITLDGTMSAKGVTFQTSGSATLAGGVLSLYGNGISIPQYAYGSTDNAPHTINSSITLSASQAWSNNSTNILTIGGNISNGGSLLTIGGTGNTVVSGVLGSGAGGLAKTGAGSLTLNSANTFTGASSISGGKVVLKSLTGLGTTGVVTPSNGASLELSNDGTSPTWAPTFTVGGLDLSAGDSTIPVGRGTLGNGVSPSISGPVTLGGGRNTTVGAGSNVNVDTAYSLTFSGTSTLNNTQTLTVNNNRTGAGTLTISTLALNAGGAGGTLDAAGSGQIWISAFTSNSKPLTLGAGSGGQIVWNVSAAAMGSQKFTVAGDTVYLQQNMTPSGTGGLDVTGGRLVANYAYGDNATPGILNYGAIRMMGGAIDTRTSAGSGNNVTYATGGVDLSQGDGTFYVGPTSSGGGKQHRFSGTLTLGGGRTTAVAGGPYITSNYNGAESYYLDFTGATAVSGAQTFNVQNTAYGYGHTRLYGALTLSAPASLINSGAGILEIQNTITTANNAFTLRATNAGFLDVATAVNTGASEVYNIGGAGDTGRVRFTSNSNGGTSTAGTINVLNGGNLVGYGGPGDSANGNYLRLGTINLQGGGIIELRSDNNDVRFVVSQLNANYGGTSRLRPGMISNNANWRHNHYVNGPVAIGGGSTLIIEPTSDTIDANETFFSAFPTTATLTGAQTIQIANNGTGAGTFQFNNLTTGGSSTLTAATTGGCVINMGWWDRGGQFNVAHALLLQGTGTGNIWWYAPTSAGSGAITLGSGVTVTTGGSPGDNNTSYIFANVGATSTHQLIISGGTLRAYSGNWNTTIATGGFDLSQGASAIVAYPNNTTDNRATRFNGAIIIGGGQTTTFSVTNLSVNNDYAISLTGSSTLTGTHTVTGTANGSGIARIGLGAYYDNGNNAGSSGATLTTSGAGAAQLNLTGAASMSLGSISVANGAPLTVNNTATSTIRLATGGGSITLNDDLTLLGNIYTDLGSSSTPTGGKKVYIGGASAATLTVDKEPGGDNTLTTWLNGLSVKTQTNGTMRLYTARWNCGWTFAGLDLAANGGTLCALDAYNSNRGYTIVGPVVMGSGGNVTFAASGTGTGNPATFYLDTPTVTGTQTLTVPANIVVNLGARYLGAWVGGTLATGAGGGTLISSGAGAVYIGGSGGVGTVNTTAGKLTLNSGTFFWYAPTSTASGLGLDLTGGTTVTVFGNIADNGTFNGLLNVGIINFAGAGCTLKFWEDSQNVTFGTGGLNLTNTDATIMVGGRNGNDSYTLTGAVILGSGRITTIRNSEANYVATRSNNFYLSGLATLTGTHTFNVIVSPNTEYAPLTLSGGLTTTGGVPATLNFTGTVATGIGSITVAASAPLTLNGNSAANTISGATLTANDKVTLASGTHVITGAGPAAGGGGIDVGAGVALRIERSVGDNVTHVTLNGAGVVNMAGSGAIFEMRSTSANQQYTLNGLNLSNADTALMVGGRNGNDWFQINGGVTLGGGRTTTVRNSDNNWASGRSNPLYLSGVATLTGTHTFNVITSPNTEYAPFYLNGGLTSAGGALATLNKTGTQPIYIGAVSAASSTPLTLNRTDGTFQITGNLTADARITLTGAGTFEMPTRTVGGGTGGGLDVDGVTLLLSANDSTSPNNTLNVGGGVGLKNSGVLELRNSQQPGAGYATTGLRLADGNGTIVFSRSGQGGGFTQTISGAATLGNARSTTISSGVYVDANSAYGISLSGTATLDGSHTFTVNNNGTGLATLTVAGLTLAGGATTTHTLTKNGTGTMTVSTTFTNTDGDNFTVNVASGSWMTITPAVAMGAGKLTKDGDGELWFSNSGSTGTGGIDINAGGLGCSANGAGTLNSFKMGTLTLKGGGSLRTRNDNNGTYATDGMVLNQGNSSFSIQRNAAGTGPTHTFSGSAYFGGGYTTTVNAGNAVNANTAYQLNFSGAASVNGTHNWTISPNGTSSGKMSLDGAITLTGADAVLSVAAPSGIYGELQLAGTIGQDGSARGLTKTGDGRIRITGVANTYTGPTKVQGAEQVLVNLIANGGAVSSVGQSGNAASNLILDGGTLGVSGTATVHSDTDRLFTVTELGGTLRPSVKRMYFSNNGNLVFSGAGNRTLALGGTYTTGSSYLYPVVSDPSSGTTALTKVEIGIWELGGTSANTYSGGTTVSVGTLVVSKDGGLGNGAVSVTGGKIQLGHAGAGRNSTGNPLTFNVANGGYMEITTVQTTFPTIYVAAGGALVGNLTGAIYGGVGQNVFLEEGAILNPTAGGPGGDFGVDMYIALNALSGTFDVSPDWIYPKGGVFGSWTPAGSFGGSIDQTVSGGGSSADFEVKMNGTSQTISGAQLKLKDPSTTKVRFTGTGALTVGAAPGGNATTYRREGPGWTGTAGWNTTVSNSLGFANSANMIGAGQKWTVLDGLARIDNASLVNAAGTLEIGSGGWLSMGGGQTISTGNFRFLAGGGWRITPTDTYNIGGVSYYFEDGSVISSVVAGSVDLHTKMPAADGKVDYIVSGDQATGATTYNIRLGNGRRITTAYDNNAGAGRTFYVNQSGVTLANGIIGVGAAGSTYILSAAATNTLTVSEPIDLTNGGGTPAGGTLQIGDTSSYFATAGGTEGVDHRMVAQTGTVQLNLSNANLVLGSSGGINVVAGWAWFNTANMVNDRTVTIGSAGTIYSTVADGIAKGTTGSINNSGLLYGGATDNAFRGANLILNAGGQVIVDINNNGDRDFGSTAASLVKIAGSSTVNVRNNQSIDRTAYFGPLDFTVGGAKLTVTDTTGLGNNARFPNLGVSGGSPWTANGEIETTTGDAIIQGTVYNTTGVILTKTGSRTLFLRADSSGGNWTGAGGLAVNAGWVVVDSAANVLGTTTGTQVNNGGYLQSNYGNVTGPTSAINGSTVTINSGGYLYADNGTSYHLAGGTIVLNGGTLWANIGTNGDRDFGTSATSIIKVNANSTLDVVNSDNGWNRADKTAYLGVLGFAATGAKLTVTDRNAYPWAAAGANMFNNARFATLGLAAGSPWTANGEIEATTGDIIINGAVYDASGLTLTKSGARYLYLRGDSSATWSGSGGLLVNAGWVVLDTAKSTLGATTGTQVNGGMLQLAYGVNTPAGSITGSTLTAKTGGTVYVYCNTSNGGYFMAGGTLILDGGKLQIDISNNGDRDLIGSATTTSIVKVLSNSTLDVVNSDNGWNRQDRTAYVGALGFGTAGAKLTITDTSPGYSNYSNARFASVGLAASSPWSSNGEIETTTADAIIIGSVYNKTTDPNPNLTLTLSGGRYVYMRGSSQTTWDGAGGLIVNNGGNPVFDTTGYALGATTGTQINSGGTIHDHIANGINGARVTVNVGGLLWTSNTANSLAGGDIRLNGGVVRAYNYDTVNFGGNLTVQSASTVEMQGHSDRTSNEIQIQNLIFGSGNPKLTVNEVLSQGTAGMRDRRLRINGALDVTNNGQIEVNRHVFVTAVTGDGTITKTGTAGYGLYLYGDNSARTYSVDAQTGGYVEFGAAKSAGVGHHYIRSGGQINSQIANALNNGAGVGATLHVQTGGLLYSGDVATSLTDGNVSLEGGTIRLYQYDGKSFGGKVTVNANSTFELQNHNDRNDASMTIQSLAFGTSPANPRLTVSELNAVNTNPQTTRSANLLVSATDLTNPGELAISNVDYVGLYTITGAGGTILTKSGAGNLYIRANNAATWSGAGGLLVTGGTVVIDTAANGLGTTTGTQINGATLQANVANAINGATVRINNGGVLYASCMTSAFAGGSIVLNGSTARTYNNSTYAYGGAFSILDNSTMDIQDDNNNRQSQFASFDFTGVGKTLTMTQSSGTGGAATTVLGSLGVSAGNPWHQSGEVKLTSGGGAYIHGVYDTTGLVLTKSGSKTLTIDTTSNQTLWTGTGGLVVNQGWVVGSISYALGTTSGNIVNNGGTYQSNGANGAGTGIRINAGGLLYASSITSGFAGSAIILNGGTARTYNNSTYAYGGAFSVLDNSALDIQDDNNNRQSQFASFDFTGVGKTLTMTQSSGTGGAASTVFGSLGASAGNPWHQSGELKLTSGGTVYIHGVYDTTGLFLSKSGTRDLVFDTTGNQATWTGAGGLIASEGNVYLNIARTLGGTTGNQVTNNATLVVNNVIDAANGATIAVNNGGTLYGNDGNQNNILRGATINLNQGSRLLLRDQAGQTWGTGVTVNGDAVIHVVGFNNVYSAASKLTGLTVAANSKTLTVSEKGENSNDMDRWVQIEGNITLGANNVTINTAADPGIALAAAGALRQYTTGNLFGSGIVTKNGTGDILLQSNNSGKFTGTVTQNGGTIYAGNTKVFGDTPTVTINGGTMTTGWGGNAGGADTFGTGTVNINSGATLIAGQYGNYSAIANTLRGATINVTNATVSVHNDAATALGGNFAFQGVGNILNLSAAQGVTGSHTFGTLTINGGATSGLSINGRAGGTADTEAYFTALTMNQTALLTIGEKGRLRVDSITNQAGLTPALRIDACDTGRTFTLGGGGDNFGFTGDVVLNTNAKMVLGANMVNGGVTINSAGILDLNGADRNLKRLVFNTGAAFAAGATKVNILSGGYLGGTGTIDSGSMGRILFASGAGVAPGSASVGTLTIQSNLTLPDNAVYYWEVASTGSADLLDVTSGAFNPGAHPTLMIIDAANPPAVLATDEITVARWTGADPAVVPWTVDYGGSNFGSGGRGGTINWDGGGNDGIWDTATNWDKSGFDVGPCVIKYYESDGVTVQPAGGGAAGGVIKVTGIVSGALLPSSASDVFIKNSPPNPLVVTGSAVSRTVRSLTLGGGALTARLKIGAGSLTASSLTTVQSNGYLDLGAGTFGSPTLDNHGQVNMDSGSTASIPVLNNYTGGTVTFGSGAGGTVTVLNVTGGTINYAGGNLATGNFTGGTLNVTGGTMGVANVSTGVNVTLSGGTVGTLTMTGGTVAQSGSSVVTTANITGGTVTITGGAMTTTTVNPSGLTSATVTGFRGGTGSSSLTVSGSGASVTIGAGGSVATADFSVGTGTVNAFVNPLTITSQLRLAGGLTGTLTGGASLTVDGANIVADNETGSNARGFTLSGGTLAFNGAIAGVQTNFSEYGTTVTGGFQDFFTGSGVSSANWSNITANVSQTGDGQVHFAAGSGNLFFRPGTDYRANAVNVLARIKMNSIVASDAGRSGLLGGFLDSNGLSTQFLFRNTNASGGNSPNTFRLLDEGVTWSSQTGASVWSLGTWYWLRYTYDPSTGVTTGKYWPADGTTVEPGSAQLTATLTKRNGWTGLSIGSGDALDVDYVLIQNSSLSSLANVGMFVNLVNFPNTTLAITSSSTLNLGGTSSDFTLGVLTLTAGATPTTLTIQNANSLTFTGGITVNGSAGQTAGIAGSPIRVAAGNVSVPASVTLTVASSISGGNALTKVGDGALILSGSNSYSGATAINAGSLAAAHASALSGTPSVTVAVGTALDYAATADAQMAINGTLTLTGGSGTAIGGAIGAGTSSAMINVTGIASASGNIKVNIHGIPGVTPTTGTYTLLQAAGGSTLNNGSYSIGTFYNVDSFLVGSLNVTATTITIGITPTTPLNTVYWKGGLSGTPNVWAASNGSTASNWASDSGGTATPLTPTSSADVIFSATGASNQGSMILGDNMSIKGLTVNDTATVTLTSDGYTLTVGTNGVTVNSGAGAVTLSNLALGGNQTWINNSANTFTLAGPVSCGSYTLAVQGTGNTTINGAIVNTAGITKSGAGTLTLAGGASSVSTINVSAGTVTVNGGTVATVNLSGTGNLTGSNTVTTVNATTGGTPGFGGKAGTLNVSGATTLTIGAGATVGTADFSAGTGTVVASPNALTVTNCLKLVNGATATLTGGTSFTVSGSDIVTTNAATVRKITLSGGTLSFPVGNPPVANYAFWLDASSLTGTDGSTVSSWNWKDASSTTRAMTLVNSPTLKTGGNGIANLNVVRFAGGYAYTDAYTNTTTGATVFAAARENSVQGGYSGIISASTQGNVNDYDNIARFALDHDNSTGLKIEHNGSFAQSFYTPTAGRTFVWSLRSDIAANSDTTYLKDSTGSSYSSTSSRGTGTFNINRFVVGARWYGNAFNQGWSGDVGEVIAYNSNLSTSDRQTVEDYLYNKWINGVVASVFPSNTSIEVTSSSTLNVNNVACDQVLAGLSLIAGSTTTTLTMTNAHSVSFTNVTATGSSGQSAAIAGSPVRVATGGAISVASGVTLTVQPAISGTGALTKTGTGTMVVPAGTTNTYSGITTVSAGTLQVRGAFDSQASAVTIGNNATLTGTGTINRPVTVQTGGMLAPGVGGIGTMTITGPLNLAGQNEFEVTKYNGLRTNDKIMGLTSAPDLTGSSWAITLSGSGFVDGDKWKLFEWSGGGTITGSLTTMPPPPEGFYWHNFGTPDSRNYVNPSTGEVQLDLDASIKGTVMEFR